MTATVMSPAEAVQAYHAKAEAQHQSSVAYATRYINEQLTNSSGTAEFEIIDGNIVRWSGGFDGSVVPVGIVSLAAALDALKAAKRSYKLKYEWYVAFFLGVIPVPYRTQVLQVG